jgi:hypothetical protein
MKRIPLFLCALTALGVGLASCAPATALAQPTEVATKVASSIPEPTKTALPTKTPEPTATPEVHMTLEDWEKMFSGPIVGGDGFEYELENVFIESEILAGSSAIERLEAMEKSGVTNTTAITILNPDGRITIIAEPAFAIERVKNGASVLVARESKYVPADDTIWILLAATKDSQEGNHKITHIEFGEITSVKFSFNPGSTDRIGLFIPIKHMIDMPKHFKVRMTGMDRPMSLAEAGITDIDPDNWVDDLMEAGVQYIDIYAQ